MEGSITLGDTICENVCEQLARWGHPKPRYGKPSYISGTACNNDTVMEEMCHKKYLKVVI